MARLHTVKKARKSTKDRKCRRCGHEIEAGEPYKYLDKRMGFTRFYTMRIIYCAQHFPKASELAAGKTSQLLSICEGLTETIDGAESAENITDAMSSAASDIESLADEYQEGADNIEQGFQHETEQSQAMAEKGEELRTWAGELEEFEAEDEAELEDVKEAAMELAGTSPG